MINNNDPTGKLQTVNDNNAIIESKEEAEVTANGTTYSKSTNISGKNRIEKIGNQHLNRVKDARRRSFSFTGKKSVKNTLVRSRSMSVSKRKSIAVQTGSVEREFGKSFVHQLIQSKSKADIRTLDSKLLSHIGDTSKKENVETKIGVIVEISLQGGINVFDDTSNYPLLNLISNFSNLSIPDEEKGSLFVEIKELGKSNPNEHEFNSAVAPILEKIADNRIESFIKDLTMELARGSKGIQTNILLYNESLKQNKEALSKNTKDHAEIKEIVDQEQGDAQSERMDLRSDFVAELVSVIREEVTKKVSQDLSDHKLSLKKDESAEELISRVTKLRVRVKTEKMKINDLITRLLDRGENIEDQDVDVIENLKLLDENIEEKLSELKGSYDLCTKRMFGSPDNQNVIESTYKSLNELEKDVKIGDKHVKFLMNKLQMAEVALKLSLEGKEAESIKKEISTSVKKMLKNIKKEEDYEFKVAKMKLIVSKDLSSIQKLFN